VCVLNQKELKTPKKDSDFGLIKQIRAFIRKFSSNQIQVGDYHSLKFIFFKFNAGGHGTGVSSKIGYKAAYKTC
jgi:hypothetical protein